MVNYGNAKIYKIECDDGYFYYGSTCLTLAQRTYGHKQKINMRNTKVYNFLRTCKNWKLVLVENYPCENKYQLLLKEKEYIESNLDNEKCLNSYKPLFDYKMYHQKYYQINKDKLIDYAIQYQKNKRIEV